LWIFRSASLAAAYPALFLGSSYPVMVEISRSTGRTEFICLPTAGNSGTLFNIVHVVQ